MTFKIFEAVGQYLETEVRERASKANSHWFDADSMRFFSSRVLELMWLNPKNKDILFISSEADNGPTKHNGSTRAYTVRKCTLEGDIDTIGTFQGYSTKREAQKTIKSILEENGVLA